MHPDLQARLDLAAAELNAFLCDPARAPADQAEVVHERIDHYCRVAAGLEHDYRGPLDGLRVAQQRGRDLTAPAFSRSWLASRAREWPRGYPGDYLLLEAAYARAIRSEGIGAHIDAYFHRQTLAVAVRSRLRGLSALLRRRAKEEVEAEAGPGARWLNLACGSARELLDVPVAPGREIVGIDQDAEALEYARDLLAPAGHVVRWETRNAFRFSSAEATRRRYGLFTTIYSAGLFDYLDDEPLTALLAGLYGALAPGGQLIAAFKDAERYLHHPYHWVVRWHQFFQRTEPRFRELLARAGIPSDRLELVRDESGVILFFLARR